jgi:hypothetical protein
MLRTLEQSPDFFADQARAGQRALKGVILYTDASGELRVIAGLNFQASWVHSLQRRLPFDYVQ